MESHNTSTFAKKRGQMSRILIKMQLRHMVALTNTYSQAVAVSLFCSAPAAL